jgi:hypothetical protein
VSASDRLLFPYMLWAHTESFASPYSLSQSGMPPAAAALFADLGVDLGFPGADALPALEKRLGEIFGVDPRRIVVTPGASGAMHLAALRWFRPGARVAVDVPSYEPFRALPELMGAERRYVARRPEQGWRLDPDEVRARLSGGDGDGHVFTSNPHNPTGALSDAREVRGLADVAAEAGGVLVSCEVYMDYLPNERRLHAFDLAPNAVTIGSLTKAFGLGALRVGWMILGEGLAAERARLVDLAYLTYIDPPTTSLRAALRALDRLPQLLQPVRQVERECRPQWERWLRETDGVDCVVPEFGIYAFPRIEEVGDTVELGRYLQREHGVDTVPGEFFGLAGHLRVGCGVPAQTLVEGLRRLGEGIAAWREGAR